MSTDISAGAGEVKVSLSIDANHNIALRAGDKAECVSLAPQYAMKDGQLQRSTAKVQRVFNPDAAEGAARTDLPQKK